MTIRREPLLACGAFVVVLLVAFSAWWYERPPDPLPDDAPPEQFSAARARDLLANIAIRPHVTGSSEHTRVREWLVAELDEMGFEVDVQESTPVRVYSEFVAAETVRNIVARQRGTDSTGGIALVAHYDTRELAPGASDDGAGVVATLEAARAIAAAGPLRNDLYVILTDAEELGNFAGAAALIATHPWWPEIQVVLNFEARGSSGPSVLFETHGGNGWILREYARADPHPTGSSMYYEIYRRMPNGTDFSTFKGAGAAGLNFGFVEGADVYHSGRDTIDRLSLASLQHHGEHARALGTHFGNLDLSAPPETADVVYFRLPWVDLVIYSAGWARIFAACALVLAGLLIWLGMSRRGLDGRRRLDARDMLAGLAAVAAAGALAAFLSFLMLVLVRLVHHEDGSIAGRLLYDETWYVLAVVGFAVGSLAAALAMQRRRYSVSGLVAGALLIPLALAFITSWFAPGVSMLFVWPAVLALAALLRLVLRPAGTPYGWLDFLVFGLLSVPAVLVLFPLPYAVFISRSIAHAPLLAASLVLCFSCLLPLVDLATAGLRRLPVGVFAAAVVCMMTGLAMVGPGPERPLPVSLMYLLDRDAGSAAWATSAQDTPPWLAQFVAVAADADADVDVAVDAGANTVAGDPDEFLRNLRAEPGLRLGRAPLVPAPPVGVSQRSQPGVAGGRRVRVMLRSELGRESIQIYPAPDQQVALQAVAGSAILWPEGSAGQADWLLSHRGIPPGGVLSFDVVLPAGSAGAELIVLETRMSLPLIAGFDMRRPAGLTAPLNEVSDTSRFFQRIRID